MKRHIALVGFMASGKTTLGHKLARKLHCAFFDTDAMVAGVHGSVSEIFDVEGEAAFRLYEADALREILENGAGGVIALGGGALNLEENRKLLKKRAYRIFIKASPEQVLERLRHGREIRPLLGPDLSLAKIKTLYTKRMPYYAHADHVVASDVLTGTQIVDDIIRWLQKKRIEIS